MNKKTLVLTGPTAVGKSEVAIYIAREIPAEIVSVDSMQVYRDMDIGTAKPSQEERREIPHHLIDIVGPNQEFSVAEFQERARKAIGDIFDRGKLPILVGGSGLYIRAVIDRFEFPQGQLNSEIRKRLEEALNDVGPQALYEKLKELDPKAAEHINPRNSRRVIRALEVIESTGCLFSDFQKEWSVRESIYDVKLIALNLPRSELYARIDERVEGMISEGLIEETQALLSCGYGEAVTSRQALGYRQVLDYLQKRISLEECISQIKQQTKRLAKRQLTWLRQDPRVVWIDVSGKSLPDVACKIIDYLRANQFVD